MRARCLLAGLVFWDLGRGRDSIRRAPHPSGRVQTATFREDSAQLHPFHSFEWRRAGPAALRCGSEKCTGSKGARLAHRPFPETRQLSRGNIRESRQPTDGSGARRSQVQPDRLLRKDTLDLELLLLFGRVPNARIRRRCSKGDRKSTRLNSSHGYISYAVFCLKKKKT